MAKTIKIPNTGGVTGVQTVTYYPSYDGLTSRQLVSGLGTYTQLRETRKDPTVALARDVFISSILAGSWNIEADDDVNDDARLFMEHILSLREEFLRTAITYGRIDFGWQGYEKIFVSDGNRIYIDSLKPLLHDMTSIMVTPQGRFNGYRQNPMNGAVVDLSPDKCLHIVFDAEAGNLYGYPLLENIRAISTMWGECNDGARRYDKKIAGAHWVIHYPPGTSLVDDVATDNGAIAAQMLSLLESSGNISLPSTAVDVVQQLTNTVVADVYAWKVELITAESKQTSFNDRLKYLDIQKIRGLLLPERAIVEGTHGTKAEAGEHKDSMITNFENIDKQIASMVNKQLVDPLVELNFGPGMVGKIKLIVLPLIDTQVEFLRQLYSKLNDPNVNIETLANKLDVPQMDKPIVQPKPAETNEDAQQR